MVSAVCGKDLHSTLKSTARYLTCDHHWSVLFVVFLAFGPTVLSGCDAVYGNTSESVQGKCVHTVIA